MTDNELEELLTDCPRLYHMAQRGSWPAIRDQGLLSTSSLLDLYGVEGEARDRIEHRHRPASVAIAADGQPGAVVRDQIPMSDEGLRRALPARIAVRDWYETLNSKVFFWLTRERLLKLTCARSYRDSEHDVLEIDTRSLVAAHRAAIRLCPINSGCTKPMPHPRDERTFLPIADYPYAAWRQKRRRGERVVELAVEAGVPDIADHVRRVVVMRGEAEVGTILP